MAEDTAGPEQPSVLLIDKESDSTGHDAVSGFYSVQIPTAVHMVACTKIIEELKGSKDKHTSTGRACTEDKKCKKHLAAGKTTHIT